VDGTFPDATILTCSQSPLLSLFLRNFQPFLLPQSVDPFPIHHQPFSTQQRPDPPVSVPGMHTHMLQHPSHQMPFVVRLLRFITLRAPWLIHQLARTSFAHLEFLFEVSDRSPLP
jgi:hypothetical protein